MSAQESRKVFEDLARRIGLVGEEFTAWVDAREAARLQEEKEQLEFEREMEEEEKELEEMRLRTLQLKLQLAEVEKTRIVKKQCSRTPCMSTNEQAAEGCDVGSTFLREKSNSVVGGGSGFHHEHSREPGAQPESNVEVRGASRRSSGELDEAEDSFAGVEQKSSSWDGLYFGTSVGSSTDNNEERVPPGCSEDRAWVVSDNAEYPLADCMASVTNYSCGPLDAAASDMGTVVEDQLEGSHKNVMLTSESGEDGDVSGGTEAVGRNRERRSEEFTDAIDCFQSKEREHSREKILGFGAFRELSTNHEVRMPLGNYGEYRTNFEREVDTAECALPAVGTRRADMVDYHADDLPTMRRRSRVDAEWICRRWLEKSVGGILLELPVEPREVMVGCGGVPEVDVGSKAREFLRNIADVNASSVASSDAETFADRSMQNTGMKESAVRRMHGGCTWQHLCTNCWFRALRSSISPIVLVCSYRQATDAERFKAYLAVASAKQVKTSIRLVWDAVT